MPCGVGLGLRWELFDELLELKPELSFVEVSPENYIGRGGYHRERLAEVRALYPMLTHGLTMSLGGFDPFRVEYMNSVQAFIREVGSPWHSDHMCFSVEGGRVLHDLLPVGFTKANVPRIADRIRRAQDMVGVPMSVENISFYMHPGHAEMTEAEFLGEVCEAADCGLMLDVNNAYVNSVNFGFDVDAWMKKAPLHRVTQMHVAGHERFADKGHAVEDATLLVDTHGADVSDPVLALLGRVLAVTGEKPVVLERDQNIPALPALLAEVARIKSVYAANTSGHAIPDAAGAQTQVT